MNNGIYDLKFRTPIDSRTACKAVINYTKVIHTETSINKSLINNDCDKLLGSTRSINPRDGDRFSSIKTKTFEIY